MASSNKYQKWEINDFSEGIVDKIVDDHLTPNAFPDAQNFIATKYGSVKTRNGQRHLNERKLPGRVQGLYSYYGNDKRQIIAVAGGKGFLWNQINFQFNEIKAELNQSVPVRFETCVNYMVAANGVNPPWKWDGEVSSYLDGAPADGQLPTLYKEKLFLVPRSDPSMMVWSKSFYPEDWTDLQNYMYVNEGDGDIITNLCCFMDELVIFKRHSIHILLGSDKSNFRLTSPETKVGAVGPHAVTRLQNTLYFIADDGLYAWNGMSATNLIRERIPGIWEKINLEYIDKAAVVSWKGMVWFALPEKPSINNNMVLVYIPFEDGGKWWVWRGIEASCFSIFNSGDENILFSGDVFGYVNQQDVGTSDFGQPISAYIVSPTLDKDPEVLKYFTLLQVMDSPKIDNVDVQMAFDYGEFAPLVSHDGDDLVRTYRFYDTYKGRVLQVKLLYNGSDTCEVRGFKVYYDKVRIPR